MIKIYPVRKSCLVIKVREVKIVKEVKEVMACDVSPVAMFYLVKGITIMK